MFWKNYYILRVADINQILAEITTNCWYTYRCLIEISIGPQ